MASSISSSSWLVEWLTSSFLTAKRMACGLFWQQRLSQRVDLAHQFFRLDNAGDEPKPAGFVGLEDSSLLREQLRGCAFADLAHQERSDNGRDEADADFGVAKASVGGDGVGKVA